MEAIVSLLLFTVLFFSEVFVAAQTNDCILGNWYDVGTVPNAQLMFRVQQSPDGSELIALALTANPQWATGSVSYNPGTRAVVIALDDLEVIKGTISPYCSNITWSVPAGAVWLKVPPVQNVHVVFMNHLDVGYARFIADIINEYFDTYFPRAIRLAAAAETWRMDGGFIYTTHPWLVNLYLDCPPNLIFNGIPVHCPNESAIAAFEKAISKGYIAWHAGPMNMQIEFLDSMLLSAGLTIADNLDDKFQRSSTVLSQRDVPGLTIASIPTLRRHGVKGVSVGVNPGSAPPAVPKIFLWEYKSESVIALWHAGGYPLNPGPNLQDAGGISLHDCTLAPNTTHVLCFAFRTDNTGPPTSLQELDTYYQILREEYPQANVFASTLDNFLANVSISALPVVSGKEIGDNWIQGIASDPLKCSTYRAASLGFSECMQAGDCNMKDPVVLNATRFLLKLPEHTWGLPGIPDEVNWSNEQFQKARNKLSSYTDNENSWKEQRMFLNLTLDACRGHKLYEYIEQHLAETKPHAVVTSSYKKIDPSQPISLWNGSVTLGFDTITGSINQLTYLASPTEKLIFASHQNQLGVLTYHTYNETDFEFMNAHYHYYGNAGYDKPNSTVNAHPESKVWTVKLVELLQSTLDPASFIIKVSMENETTHTNYGAPFEVWITVHLNLPQMNARKSKIVAPLLTIDFDMLVIEKTPTRLPEATMFSFYPSPPTGSTGWTGSLGKVENDGSTEIDVGSVVMNGSQYQHAVQYVKLTASSSLKSDNGYQKKVHQGFTTVWMNSTYIPLICPITGDGRSPTPFPAPLDPLPDSSVVGIAFNIHNNIWNTNYPLYYPFVEEDANFRSRFTVSFL